MKTNVLDDMLLSTSTARTHIAHLQRLLIYDYFILCYQKQLENSNNDIYGIDNAEKMMASFLLVCLNSVRKDDYGLFELFDIFLIDVDNEGKLRRVGNHSIGTGHVQMPGYRLIGNAWYAARRPAIWNQIADQNIVELLRESDTLAPYAEMVDEGIEEIIALLPEICLRGKSEPTENSKWSTLKKHFSTLDLAAFALKNHRTKKCKIVEELSTSQLVADREKMLGFIKAL